MRCWESLSGSASASAAACVGAATSSSAALSFYGCSGKSIIGRQFTSLRYVDLADSVNVARHGCCQISNRSSQQSAPPAQQLRAFAAGGSSGSSSTGGGSSSRAAVAPSSGRTAQRAWAEQKSSSQALYLASTPPRLASFSLSRSCCVLTSLTSCVDLPA